MAGPFFSSCTRVRLIRLGAGLLLLGMTSQILLYLWEMSEQDTWYLQYPITDGAVESSFHCFHGSNRSDAWTGDEPLPDHRKNHRDISCEVQNYCIGGDGRYLPMAVIGDMTNVQGDLVVYRSVPCDSLNIAVDQ
jgi:hypothetical protein